MWSPKSVHTNTLWSGSLTINPSAISMDSQVSNISSQIFLSGGYWKICFCSVYFNNFFVVWRHCQLPGLYRFAINEWMNENGAPVDDWIYCLNTPSQCHFFHHKTDKDVPGIESGPRRQEFDHNHLSHGTNTLIIKHSFLGIIYLLMSSKFFRFYIQLSVKKAR
jgi:hypothetical protein